MPVWKYSADGEWHPMRRDMERCVEQEYIWKKHNGLLTFIRGKDKYSYESTWYDVNINTMTQTRYFDGKVVKCSMIIRVDGDDPEYSR